MPSHWSHDIRDPEAFVSRIIVRSHRRLDHFQRERLEQYLLITLWELSRKYHTGGVKFSTYAGNILPKRVVEWERSAEEGGRRKWQFRNHTHERVRVHVDSLDRLGAPEPGGVVDGPQPGAADFLRLLGTGAGDPPSGERELGEETDGRAA